MSPSNNDEVRFEHLLQPIRDLTRNWQVDIATQLEDYLSELGTVAISFDDGKTTMNFAEAALLIQGSACVYSKKVEFLHSMVYQTLDVLASQKKQKQASSVDADGNDADATFAYDKSRQEFLTLDDIPGGKSVRMKNVDDEISDKSVRIASMTPLSLIKMEELDRGIPLINRKGETIAYRTDFKLNSEGYHSSGLMLADMAHYSLLEQSLLGHPASTPLQEVQAPDAMEEEENLIPDIPEDNFNDQPPLNNSLDDVDMDDVFEGLNNSLENVKEEVGRAGLRPQRLRPPLTVVEFKRDPWEMLNPDEHSEEKEKPHKKGRRFRLPPSLAAAKGRKRKRTVEKKPLTPLVDFISKAYYSHASKLPSNPIKVPSHLDFEDAFYTIYKKREVNMKKEKASQMKQAMLEEEDGDEYAKHDQAPTDAFPGAVADIDEDDHYPLDGFDPDPDDDLGGGGMDMMPNPSSQESAHQLVTDYEDLVRGYVDAYMANAENYAQTSDLARRVQQWEDKIHPILQQEEDQGSFDIHDSGTKLLRRLEERTKAGEERSFFMDCVTDCSNFEISRMFLASLQLANNYNVEVSAMNVPGEARVDTMQLKLLSLTRHHEEMAEYKAPSVQ